MSEDTQELEDSLLKELGDEIHFTDKQGRKVLVEKGDGELVKVNEQFGHINLPEDQEEEGTNVTVDPHKDDKGKVGYKITEEDKEDS